MSDKVGHESRGFKNAINKSVFTLQSQHKMFPFEQFHSKFARSTSV